jgi:hypothetical protein
MILWIESQSTVTIALLVFALSYALAAVIFAAACLVAQRRVAVDLKATTPVMLTPLSVIAGLLIAFLASHVWSNIDHAHAYIAQEGSALRDVVMLADELPADVRNTMRSDVKKYLQFIETSDWPAMTEGRASWQQSPPGLAEAMMTLLAFAPRGPGEQVAQQGAAAAIERAIEARRGRIVLSRAVIAPIQWIVVAVLAALVLLTIAMVHIDRRATAAVNLGIFATAVAASLVLLMVNDRPFAAGGITLDPGVLREIVVN